MRRKGIFMAVLMVVLGISAFMAIQQNRHEQQDIAAILDHQAQIDKIVIQQQQKTIATIKDDVQRYVEPTPLVHIAPLERKMNKKFEKDARYTMNYYYDNKLLYTVDVLRLKQHEPLTASEKQFVFTVNGASYMLVWQPYEKQLSQHDHTVKLLKKIQ